MLRFIPLLCLAVPAAAHEARVDGAEFRRTGETWTVAVTLSHAETGWDDYADSWRIEAPDGTVLGTRGLAHPHAEEQPFTRSLSGLAIPKGLTEVRVRTRTTATGWSEDTTTVRLP